MIGLANQEGLYAVLLSWVMVTIDGFERKCWRWQEVIKLAGGQFEIVENGRSGDEYSTPAFEQGIVATAVCGDVAWLEPGAAYDGDDEYNFGFSYDFRDPIACGIVSGACIAPLDQCQTTPRNIADIPGYVSGAIQIQAHDESGCLFWASLSPVVLAQKVCGIVSGSNTFASGSNTSALTGIMTQQIQLQLPTFAIDEPYCDTDTVDCCGGSDSNNDGQQGALPCCPGAVVPNTLCCLLTNISGCSALDGTALLLTWNGLPAGNGQAWTGTFTVGGASTTLSLTYLATNTGIPGFGQITQCYGIALSGACAFDTSGLNGAAPTLAGYIQGWTVTCDPFSVSAILLLSGCCSGYVKMDITSDQSSCTISNINTPCCSSTPSVMIMTDTSGDQWTLTYDSSSGTWRSAVFEPANEFWVIVCVSGPSWELQNWKKVPVGLNWSMSFTSESCSPFAITFPNESGTDGTYYTVVPG